MDYLPPDKPVLVAKADERQLTQHHKHLREFVDIGKIDHMPATNDWASATTFEQWQAMLKSGLKPGLQLIFAKPKSASEPVLYIRDHKPCTPTVFNAFRNLLDERTDELNEAQVQSIAEILGEKANAKTYFPIATVTTLGGRKGINVHWDRKRQSTHYLGRSFYFISDAHKRVIEEVGYEGAKGQDHWRQEAEDMLNRIEFIPPEK